MDDQEISNITIGARHFDAVRATDGNGLGYIEVREPGSPSMHCRITYQGPNADMVFECAPGGVPRELVQWLLVKADEALA